MNWIFQIASAFKLLIIPSSINTCVISEMCACVSLTLQQDVEKFTDIEKLYLYLKLPSGPSSGNDKRYVVRLHCWLQCCCAALLSWRYCLMAHQWIWKKRKMQVTIFTVPSLIKIVAFLFLLLYYFFWRGKRSASEFVQALFCNCVVNVDDEASRWSVWTSCYT